MKRFSYCVEYIADKDRLKDGTCTERVEEDLNLLGDEGWEMIFYDVHSGCAIFKREQDDDCDCD